MPAETTELAKLAWRLVDVPAEAGLDRWPAILKGRKRSEFANDEPSEQQGPPKPKRPAHWEELCGPLTMTAEEAWAAMPLVHAMRAEGVVSAEEEETAHERMRDLYVDYSDFDQALALAKPERARRSLYQDAFSHSEVDVAFFASVLLRLRRVFGHLKVPNAGSFVECGSGLGKNVYVAALTHSWRRCVGVEKLEAFTEIAKRLQPRFNDVTCASLTQHQRDERDEEALEFVCGDFFDDPEFFVTATLVYADLTCVPLDGLLRFTALVADLATGAVVVTLSRALDTDALFLLWSQAAVRTSWGRTTAYVYERKPPPLFDEN